jgi:hypothetical protein
MHSLGFQAAAAQLESLAGEWQAYHDAEVATLREQLASAQGDAEGANASLQEQLQQATSVRRSPHKLLPCLSALHTAPSKVLAGRNCAAPDITHPRPVSSAEDLPHGMSTTLLPLCRRRRGSRRSWTV